MLAIVTYFFLDMSRDTTQLTGIVDCKPHPDIDFKFERNKKNFESAIEKVGTPKAEPVVVGGSSFPVDTFKFTPVMNYAVE
jgi:D-serine deaminase-like pyridoxal phosphate-dependent protein